MSQEWGDLVDQLAVIRERDPEAVIVVCTLTQLIGAGAFIATMAGLVGAIVAGIVPGLPGLAAVVCLVYAAVVLIRRSLRK